MHKIPDRTILTWAVLATAASLLLSFIHPIFALGSVLLWAYLSYYVFNAVSRAIFSKEFHPPAKIPLPGWDEKRKWSDWVLFVPYIVVIVYLLFVFGEVSDCLAGQDFWKSGWSLCKD